MRRLIIGLLAVCMAAGLSFWIVLPVAAQEDETVAAEEETAAAEGEFMLEEVTVTAQKSEENLQKVSHSMTVITSEDLDVRATENVRQVLQNTAGVSFYGFHNTIMVRGVGTVSTDQGLEPSVQFNIDGSAQASTGIGGVVNPMLQATNDVERVEVLRGPSGSVNGRSAAAGSINIISKSPDFETVDGNVGVTIGNYETVRLSAAANFPLKLTGLDLPSFVENLSFRIAVSEDKHEGYVHNEDGEPTAGTQNARTLRARLKWQPIEPLTINMIYSSMNDRSNAGMNVPAIDVDAYGLFGPGSPFSSVAHPDDPWLNVGSRTYGYSEGGGATQYNEQVEAIYDTRFGTITGKFSYFWVPRECQSWETACYAGRMGQKEYELRINSPEDSRIKWNAGGFMFHKKEYTGPDQMLGAVDPDRQLSFQDIYGNNWGELGEYNFDPGYADPGMDVNDPTLPFIQVYKPFRDPTLYQGAIMYESTSATRPIDAYAVFANATIPLFEDRHRLVLGLRKNFEDKTRMISIGVWGWDEDNENSGLPHFTFYEDENDPTRGRWVCDNCYLVDAEDPKEYKTKDNPVDWTIGWEYDWRDDVMFYVMAKSGFKPGGFAPGAVPSRYYEPEKVVNYSVGMKSRWFDQKLQLNVDVFYMDYKNYQMNMNINEGPVRYTLHGVEYLQPYVGMSAITWNFKPFAIPGVDVDYEWLITPVDRVSGTIEFKHGRYKGVDADLGAGATFPPDAPQYPDYDGRRMPWSPDFTFYGSYTHQFNFGNFSVNPRLDAKYSTGYTLFYEYWWTSVNPEGWQDPYWKFDAFATVGPQDGTWNLDFYCKNITEEVIRNSSFFVGVNIEEPRTYGASFKVRF